METWGALLQTNRQHYDDLLAQYAMVCARIRIFSHYLEKIFWRSYLPGPTLQDDVNGDSEGLWACMDVPVRNYHSYIPLPVVNKSGGRPTSPVMESPHDKTGEVNE